MRVLTVIPARGGSRGLPGKNIRSFAGLPLIAHSIRCAQLAGLTDVIVSTDSDDIASVARTHGATVPFTRPAELATETAPMMPVIEHALARVEQMSDVRFDCVVLLDPTSPGRVPEDISRAMRLLDGDAQAHGVVAVSRPHFNPYWVGITLDEGAMRPVFPELARGVRRQDVPAFYRINGSLYVWRREFVVSKTHWSERRMLALEIPESRAFSIDTLEEFESAEWLVISGRVSLPWVRS